MANNRDNDDKSSSLNPQKEQPAQEGRPADVVLTSAQHDEPQISKQHIILFYKYHPLSSQKDIVELSRIALENLCQNLRLQGRILVGCNQYQSEGINGTLSGSYKSVKAFTQALTKIECPATMTAEKASNHLHHVAEFWKECEKFYERADCQPLVMEESEFKWSSTSTTELFPDLNIKIVKELIGTGGVLASISLEDVHKGYLTPKQWHARMLQLQEQQTSPDEPNDTILIDCRNTKEYQIGHFQDAIDPQTTTFNQFPNWVKEHRQTLANKNILMYCTGGIRCEKASAYIRQQCPSVKEVRHLKGGIHKYLDKYGGSGGGRKGPNIISQEEDNSLWLGKNFVFDGRVAQGQKSDDIDDDVVNADRKGPVSSSAKEASGDIVGSCTHCSRPYDTFDPGCVCTVCREPTLMCTECRSAVMECHCVAHQHLRTCYFTDLTPYSKQELQAQLDELQTYINEIAIGKKFKQRRKTLYKQCDKIMNRLDELRNGKEQHAPKARQQTNNELKCRNCGQIGCPGKCWGFHGLKRKQVLETKEKTDISITSISTSATIMKKGNSSNNAHLQEQKRREKEDMIRDLKRVRLVGELPSTNRHPTTGIRVPTPCTRTLQTKTKGKWCGVQLLTVLQEQFSELSDAEYLSKVMERGLIRVNDEKIVSLAEAENRRLKNMDVVSRIVHWHEPPVRIPNEEIMVQKVPIPTILQQEYNITIGNDCNEALVYVCHKPSSVPVHPAGPYLSNSLTTLVEGQEGLKPRSLIPCHRIDRVTSGITICCTNVKIARMIQGRIDDGSVQKQYLARVVGRFPTNSIEETKAQQRFPDDLNNGLSKWSWWNPNETDSATNGLGGNERSTTVLVDAPIETVDPANGIRKITTKGKASQSLFQFLSYDDKSNSSILSCTPLTGRSHQLRVHLQYLGFPIVHDVLYGGARETYPGRDSVLAVDKPPANIGVDELLKSIQESNKNDDLKSEMLSTQDVIAAKEVCPCCNNSDNLSSVFTPAQLLQGGHEICLHAFRYRIPFTSKKKKKQPAQDRPQGHGERRKDEVDSLPASLDLEVGAPEWAPECFVTNLPWPKACKKDILKSLT